MKEFVIDTTLDTKGIEKGAVDTEKIINRMVNATENASKSMASAMNNALKEMVPTEEYAQLEDEFSKLEAKMQDIGKKMDRFVALGGKEDSKTYKGYIYDLERLSDEQDKVIFKMQTMEDNGTAFANKVVPPTEQLVETTKESAQNIEKEAIAQEKLNTSAKRGVKIFGDLGKTTHSGFVNMLKYALGISSIFTLFNKLRSAIGEGIKNLAQFNNGVNPVNESLSKLISGLATIKNSLAAAFAPILTAVTPILTSFINQLVKVINYIGMFIAYITGQKTYLKAIAVNKDYAKSLGGVASTAKKAAQALASFDEAEVLNQNMETGGGAGGGSSVPEFEKINLDEIFGNNKFINTIKDLLPLVGAIGAGFLAWKLGSAFVGALPGLLSMLEGIGVAALAVGTAVAGWTLGNELYELITGDSVDMTIGEQIKGIWESITDGSWKGALELWAKDISDAFALLRSELGPLGFLMDFIIGTKIGADFEVAENAIKGSIGRIITEMNKLMDATKQLSNAMNKTLQGAMDKLNSPKTASVPTTQANFPHLASGTVVPRQAGEFAAILGDNKRETEVVSPLSTMKEAVVEAISESGGIGTGDVYITAEGDLDALIRLLRLKITQEDKRVGKSYVKAGAL